MSEKGSDRAPIVCPQITPQICQREGAIKLASMKQTGSRDCPLDLLWKRSQTVAQVTPLRRLG